MKLEQMLPATEHEKACIWDIFRAEDRLWDIEAELLNDLQYYEHRAASLVRAASHADQALLAIYQSHIRRINGLLARLPQQQPRQALA